MTVASDLSAEELAEIRERDAQMPDVVFDEKLSAEIEIWDAPLARDRRRLLLAYDALLAERDRLKKAVARGWGAWLENVLAEIDEARAADNHEYADDLVTLLQPLQAALHPNKRCGE